MGTQDRARPKGVDGGASTTVELNWGGGLKFTSSDGYGHTVVIDAPERDGEQFDGFKPGEMMLTSLAGCSGIDVVGILRKQRQDVTGIEIRVTGTQEPDPPWTWETVFVEYVVRGRNLDRRKVERAIHLSETKYCSVGATLGVRCEISSTFELVEEIA